MDNTIILYHGSDKIIKKSVYILQILDEEMKANDPRIR